MGRDRIEGEIAITTTTATATAVRATKQVQYLLNKKN